jgi:hypothetical protein
MKEADIEKHLVRRTIALGGEVRKVQWIGRVGAPDRLVMLPPRPAGFEQDHALQLRRIPAVPARTIWVELKAPGIKPESHQVREHARLKAMGQHVVVIDSIEGVEELLA